MKVTDKSTLRMRRWQAAATVQAVTMSLLVCPLALAVEDGTIPPVEIPVVKVTPKPAVFSQTSGPVGVGYSVGGGEVTVSFSSERELIAYRFRPSADAKPALRPEHFVRSWGTREGMAAVTRMLTAMMSGQRPDIERRINPPTDPTPSGVQAVALFEDAGITHLLLVRLEEERVVFDEMIGTILGCSATPRDGYCSCSADGIGSLCSSGTDQQTGVNWSICRDGPEEADRGQAVCRSKDLQCECLGTAIAKE